MCGARDESDRALPQSSVRQFHDDVPVDDPGPVRPDAGEVAEGRAAVPGRQLVPPAVPWADHAALDDGSVDDGPTDVLAGVVEDLDRSVAEQPDGVVPAVDA